MRVWVAYDSLSYAKETYWVMTHLLTSCEACEKVEF